MAALIHLGNIKEYQEIDCPELPVDRWWSTDLCPKAEISPEESRQLDVSSLARSDQATVKSGFGLDQYLRVKQVLSPQMFVCRKSFMWVLARQ